LLVQLQTPPVFGSIIITNGNVILSGTGGTTNVPYYVLASTNIAMPSTNWTRIATNNFTATGGFTYTNVLNLNLPQRFFRLELP
ncbi:MAG TPA: hypothetical protein VF437_02720, partial [Verrucomicrobiae bacterium]